MEIFMSLIIGFLAIATYVLIGVCALRIRGKRSPIVVILFASIPSYIIFPVYVHDLDMIHYTATYFFGTMLFLFFWGGLFKSISVRILCDLFDEVESSLSIESIYEKYLLTESFKGRLEILVKSDLLSLEADKTYKLTVGGRKFVHWVGMLQKIYKINASG
jgi:hypothetical protein